MTTLDKIRSLDDAPQRKVFSGTTTQDALGAAIPYMAHLQGLSTPGVEWIVLGAQADGTIDQSKYPSDFVADIAVCTLSTRIETGEVKDGKNVTKAVIKAVVVHPVPTLDSVLANPAGRDMLASLWATQANHKVVAPLRDAENLLAVADLMPVTVEAFASAGRSDSRSKLLEAFNAYANEINAFLRNNSEIWERARLTKVIIRQCLENQARATHFYPAIEETGLFEAALAGLIQLAERDGSDTTLFYKWQATRADAGFTPDVAPNVVINADSIVAALGGAVVSDDSDNDDAPAPVGDDSDEDAAELSEAPTA